MKNLPSEFWNAIKNWAIIPVFGKRTDQTEYIPWQEKCIFVKKNAVKSAEGCYVLNENLLSKSDCEAIFHVNINEFDADYERSRYNEELSRIIRNVDIEKVYSYLIAEFQKGSFEKYHSVGTLLERRGRIPLKNQMGVITATELFTCDKTAEYFPVNLIRAITAHEECMPLARYLKCNELKTIHYENIEYTVELTADDVESLLDGDFDNSDEILRAFHRKGQIPDALVAKYHLGYLFMGGIAEDEAAYDFPNAPVINATALQAHVRKQLENLARIVKVKVERTVYKGENIDGSTFDLAIKDAREGVLSIYAPEGGRGKCFCQMCGKVKPHEWIEVNNIQAAPQYYISQMRIALCLECSKYFEILRNNRKIAGDFWAAICDAKITNQGQIEIPIKECKIKFTATHLAEIQELLRNMPKS